MYNIEINALDSSVANKYQSAHLATHSGCLAQLDIPHRENTSLLAECHILRSHLHGSGV